MTSALNNGVRLAEAQALKAWEARSRKRIDIPADKLPDAAVRLTSRSGEQVFVIGTAHFSPESQREVQELVELTQPDVIMVELCPSREAIMRVDEKKILEEAKSITIAKTRLLIRQYGVIQGLTHVLLLKVSAAVTAQLGVAPGGEFRAAYQQATKVSGCRIYLGDRPMQVTLRRALARLSLWSKMCLAGSLILSADHKITQEEVERMKKQDLLEQLLDQFAGSFPDLSKVIVGERDLYLAHSLECCVTESRKSIPSDTNPVVVGVVGAGHVRGICEIWSKGSVDLDIIDDISSIPPPSLSSRITVWTIRGAFLTLVTFSLFKVGRKIRLW